MAADLVSETGIPRTQAVVLPNPIDIDSIRAATGNGIAAYWTGPGPHLLAVGRLSREKGFDLLLEAFALLKPTFPLADIAIAGAGPEAAVLRSHCRSLNLEDSVRFVGRVDSPACWFPGATLFVVSSRHEGLPNAMLEAAAARLPIVATPASGGLVDLLDHHPGVWLASAATPQALGDALNAALSSLLPQQRFSHPWIERFRLEDAVHAYEDLIDATIGEQA